MLNKLFLSEKNKNVKLPNHIGIIMDGNGRWAQKRGVPRSIGHKEGAKTSKKIAIHCKNIGINYLTMYAFSTENWNRPKNEVNFLMNLFKQYLEDTLNDFKNENIKIIVIGNKAKLNKSLQNLILKIEESSKNNDSMVLNLAINYGGRSEILNALINLIKDIKNDKVDIKDITEKTIAERLYTGGQPDPDLIIRPSGEFRISNFLLWQSAYSEYVFMNNLLWPDFTEKDLDNAINEYNNRNRRFGGV